MSSDPLTLVIVGYLAMVLFMAGLWAVQLFTRNASIADVGFCLGLMAVVCWYATEASGETERKLVVVLLACLYAGRLGAFLLVNRVLGKAEDARYQELRRSWGARERVKMFGYFQLQAAAVSAFSLPFLVVMQHPRPPFGLWELAGVVVWVAAVSGEATADWQLARFRSRPWNRGRVCREGLWYCSRHPNYFFEWLHWWGYVALAVHAPLWWVPLAAVAAMGYFIIRVTGIPPTEAQALRSRGDAYRAYQRTTSPFVPWPPRAGALPETGR